jgi:hypothetical protein
MVEAAKSITSCPSPVTWDNDGEPESGIEPLTYALRVGPQTSP